MENQIWGKESEVIDESSWWKIDSGDCGKK